MPDDHITPWPIYTEPTQSRVVELIRNGTVYDYAGRAPVTEIEAGFSELHEGAYAVSFNSGTSALYALLAALGIVQGDEVLVPNLTFLASASPLLWLGATPVLIDSHSDEPSIGPAEIRAAINSRTRAVVVTHLFGTPVDIVHIARICADHGLLLIEDCSHAHASTVAGRHVGLFGDGAIYSIGAGKLVSGGHGGLLVTRDSRIRDLALLMGHFKPRTRTDVISPDLRPYGEFALGGNLRLSPIAATLALDHLARLTELSGARRRNFDVLAKAFAGLLEPIRVDSARVNGTYFDMVFRLQATTPSVLREHCLTALNDEGIPASAPSTRPLNRVLRQIAQLPSTDENPYLQRLNQFADSAPSDEWLRHSTAQHDRMISFPAGLLYQVDASYAEAMAVRAERVLRQVLTATS